MASLAQLRILVPEVKASGFRSLINLLRSRQYINLEMMGGEQQVRLTTYGQAHLAANFPVLNTKYDKWQGEWSSIVFLTPPSGDLRFRYLRKFLLQAGCGQLTRGVYLYPGQLPEAVDKLLLKLYVGAVVVTGFKDWIFGDERNIVTNVFDIKGLQKTYSGISNEIDQLLEQRSKQKGVSDQYKSAVCLVFDRVVQNLENDLGLLHFYYPEAISGLALLEKSHQLL